MTYPLGWPVNLSHKIVTRLPIIILCLLLLPLNIRNRWPLKRSLASFNISNYEYIWIECPNTSTPDLISFVIDNSNSSCFLYHVDRTVHCKNVFSLVNSFLFHNKSCWYIIITKVKFFHSNSYFELASLSMAYILFYQSCK